MIRIHEIKLEPGEPMTAIPEHIKKKLGLRGLEIEEWRPVKESVDAREKPRIRKVYTVDFLPVLRDGKGCRSAEDCRESVLRQGRKRKLKIGPAPDMTYHFVTEEFGFEPGSPQDPRIPLKHPPVVVGFGPCGMFAALLLAQMGYRPVVAERGKAIGERTEDVERFWRDGVLDPESNVQFGEGGAGSFSDGKLTTQIKDSRIRKVLEELVRAGGGEDLLYRQKPHVGTDVLRDVVKEIRCEIQRLGGTVNFETRVTGLRFREGGSGADVFEGGERARSLCGLEISGKYSAGLPETQGAAAGDGTAVLETQTAVLALGHSARDTFRVLYDQGIVMEQKPFSIGARIEHPQSMINEAQYGKEWEDLGLGAADYKLSHRCKDGRGVYTFCMCPGGRVIASASCPGGVVTNGMSYRDRGLENANSALLVDVRTEDFESAHPLAGIAFQEKYERLAFEAGGGTYRAPAQRVGDFLAAEPQDEGEGETRPSYEPGVAWTSLDRCLPGFAAEAMREALPALGKKLAGFDRPDAVLTGVETRSSSPVRIPRGDGFTCNVDGLYPGGEGAGYAGGITSAAVDGIRLAEAIARKYRPDY
ncbi:NAD(P)/FAD-dependent oxidoreductase [Bacilliculturomica massiliensis]|uniref:NAD(P)/FAD-dependent oxidoreductase n=1 Tax=Bacilliculturomica massiliensis TaxID=1917867 RepID=UPI001030191F|nr:hypothetical protein [Bacilliculturomica massiliensis]